MTSGKMLGCSPLALPALCPGSWPKAALVGSLTLWLQLDERRMWPGCPPCWTGAWQWQMSLPEAPRGQLSPPVTAHTRSQTPRAATAPCFAGSGCPSALVGPPTLLILLYVVFSSSPSAPVLHVSSASELSAISLNPLSLFPHPYVGDHDDICLQNLEETRKWILS